MIYFLQQNISIELNIIQMLKPFPSKLGEANTASIFDILNFNITNGCYSNNLFVGSSLGDSVPFAWLLLC